MVVAADDGVMPQTREHAAVLAALGVERGVVAVTKADVADPARGARRGRRAAARRAAVVACSARTGDGRRRASRAALDARRRRAARPRGGGRRAACLHVDRAFTIKRRRHGRHRDAVVRADRRAATSCVLLPARRARSRVRGVQVHDEPVERAEAGQRVAVNLVGVEVRDVARGDVARRRRRARADVRHRRRARRCATPSTARASTSTTARARRPARLAELGGRFWQLRLEQPLLAPPRRPRRRALDRAARHARRRRRPRPRARASTARPATRSPGSRALERGEPRAARGRPPAPPRRPPAAPGAARRSPPPRSRSRSGCARPATSRRSRPSSATTRAHLPALREAGRAVRVGRNLCGAPRRARARSASASSAIIDAEGAITLARLRDELGRPRASSPRRCSSTSTPRASRCAAPDDSRVLRRRR